MSPAAAANIPILFFPDIVIVLSLAVPPDAGVFLSDIFTIPFFANTPVFSSPIDVITRSFTLKALVPSYPKYIPIFFVPPNLYLNIDSLDVPFIAVTILLA